MRSNDAVFGYNNDINWHLYVQSKMVEELRVKLNCNITEEPIIWNAGSLHVYERHFKFLQ